VPRFINSKLQNIETNVGEKGFIVLKTVQNPKFLAKLTYLYIWKSTRYWTQYSICICI